MITGIVIGILIGICLPKPKPGKPDFNRTTGGIK